MGSLKHKRSTIRPPLVGHTGARTTHNRKLGIVGTTFTIGNLYKILQTELHRTSGSFLLPPAITLRPWTKRNVMAFI